MKAQVNLSNELVEKLDKYSEFIGVSRSALCGMLIGQGIIGLDKGLEMADKSYIKTLKLNKKT